MAQPRPILKAAGIVGGALTALGVAMTSLVAAGVVPETAGHVLGLVLAVVLPLGSALGVWTFSEGQVTPLSSPANAAGVALTEPHSIAEVAKAVEPALFSFLASKYPEAGADLAQAVASTQALVTDVSGSASP